MKENELSRPEEVRARLLAESMLGELASTELPACSPNGKAAIAECISDFAEDLYLYSLKNAQSIESETISPANVRSAARFLHRPQSKSKRKVLGTLGGMIAGAGLSNVIPLFNSAPVTNQATLWTIGLCVLGAVMVAIDFARAS